MHYACPPCRTHTLGTHTHGYVWGQAGASGGVYVSMYIYLHRSVKLTVNHITYIVVSTKLVSKKSPIHRMHITNCYSIVTKCILCIDRGLIMCKTILESFWWPTL